MRKLEVMIISAQDLKDVSHYGKMTTFAVAWVHPSKKLATPVDSKNHVNPTWNTRIRLIVNEVALQQQQQNVKLTVDIYNKSSGGSDDLVASCSVPLSQLKNSEGAGADHAQIMSLRVCIHILSSWWSLSFLTGVHIYEFMSSCTPALCQDH